MSDHTPGPWKVDSKYCVGPVSQEDDQSYGMIIPVADVYGPNRKADAELIASAPQLREQNRVADQARRHAQAEGTKLVEEKRALARDRERLRDVVEEIKMALLDRYDGAPDSTTRWMGPLLADIDCAQALRHAPRSQKGAV